MTIEPIKKEILEAFLKEHPNWKEVENTLQAEFKFKDFIEAWGFLSQVAMLAEKQGHHPHIENCYSRVTLTLTTHEANNHITERDLALARAVDKL